MTENTLIDVKNVSFSYGGEPILEHIDLTISRGEFWGIIGPNGSGKTTLLKIILGLLTPTTGSVTLFGDPITAFRDWKKIGYVHQRAGIANTQFPITSEEVVAMGGASEKSVHTALDNVGMSDKKSKLIQELSGGQQQRVFIARALANNPELILLDEPTVGVDSESQTEFYELLQNLHTKHNLTLVLVSHDLDVVAHEVSHVACINKTLIGHGKPSEILKGNFMEKLYGKELRYVVHCH